MVALLWSILSLATLTTFLLFQNDVPILENTGLRSSMPIEIKSGRNIVGRTSRSTYSER